MLEKINATLRSVPDHLGRAWRTVSSTLRRHPLRPDTFRIGPRYDRARIDVIRHRIRSGLDGQRQLVVALAAVAGLGLAVVTANATVGVDQRPAADTTAVGDYTTLLDRQASAQRTDRSERGEPAEAEEAAEPEEAAEETSEADEADEASEPEPEQTRRGSEPEESPSPEPEETAEPEPDWVHPMPGARTTSCYGQRWGSLHAGVDLAAPHGTPIHAVGAGTVTHAGWVFGGYGISVVIDHQDGHLTHYAHASEAKVSPGDRVEPGDVIALEGTTGDSTGPHLHFEVHKGGLWNSVEPTGWMANRGVEIGGC